MIFDCTWILLLGLYLEQVMPKKFGGRRHPFFCFKPSFWGCNNCCKNENNLNQVDLDDEFGEHERSEILPDSSLQNIKAGKYENVD